MPSYWIHVSKALPKKREVLMLAQETKRSRHQVIGLLVEFWAWVDEETTDGRLDGLDLEGLIQLFPETDIAFWEALIRVGWLEKDRRCLTIPKFDRWLGNSAKRRNEDAERKRLARSAASSSESCPQNVRNLSASDADEKRPRAEQSKAETEQRSTEESRTSLREGGARVVCVDDSNFSQKHTTCAPGVGGVGEGETDEKPTRRKRSASPNPNPAFEKFWEAYPKKQRKREAQLAWEKLNPDFRLIQKIMGAITTQENWDQYRRGLAPDAVNWLVGERWQDEAGPLDRRQAR